MNSMRMARGARTYVFRFWGKRWLAGLMDLLGTLAVRLLTFGQGLKPDAQAISQPQRILLVRLDHIGDVLFARPALEALRQQYPQARISVLVSSAGAAVLAQEPAQDEIIVWDAPWFARAALPANTLSFWQLARKLRSLRFDLSLDLRGDLRHHILLFLAGVRVRAGYGITGGAFLLHVPLRLRQGAHEVERDLDVVRALWPGVLVEKYAPLVLTPAERQAGEEVWRKKKLRVVMHPSAGDPRKQWNPEYFAQVCSQLADLGCEVVLVGKQTEKAVAQKITGLCIRRVRVLAGETSLRELIALISAANLFVGNDSGPAHMAVTQGIPTVMLWSETNTPEEWGPWGEGVQALVVRHPNRAEAVAEVVAAAKRFLKIKE